MSFDADTEQVMPLSEMQIRNFSAGVEYQNPTELLSVIDHGNKILATVKNGHFDVLKPHILTNISKQFDSAKSYSDIWNVFMDKDVPTTIFASDTTPSVLLTRFNNTIPLEPREEIAAFVSPQLSVYRLTEHQLLTRIEPDKKLPNEHMHAYHFVPEEGDMGVVVIPTLSPQDEAFVGGLWEGKSAQEFAGNINTILKQREMTQFSAVLYLDSQIVEPDFMEEDTALYDVDDTKSLDELADITKPYTPYKDILD